MHIDKKRARAVLAAMRARYEAREFPYLDTAANLPQSYVPEAVKAEPASWARFFFYLCLYMRGGYDSVEAAKRLALAYTEHPGLFDERVLDKSESDIQRIVSGYIPIFRKVIGRFWLHNSQVLWKYWGGDPRRLFLGAVDHHELYYRLMGGRYRPTALALEAGQVGQFPGLSAGSIHDTYTYRGFLGYGQKMTSMLGYYLHVVGLLAKEPSLSAPVDFHHVRVYLQTGILRVEPGMMLRYEHLVPYGIAVAEYLQRTSGLPMHVYGDIMWLWSRDLCSVAPHNRSEEETLPNGRVVRRSVVPTWDQKDRNAYAKSCGVCAIARFCKVATPSGPYYTDGHFHIVARNPPEVEQLLLHPDLFLPRAAPTRAGSSS